VTEMSFKSGLKGRGNDVECKDGDCDEVMCVRWGERFEWIFH